MKMVEMEQEIYGNQDIIDQNNPAIQDTNIDDQEVYGNQEVINNQRGVEQVVGGEEPYMDMDYPSNATGVEQIKYEQPATGDDQLDYEEPAAPALKRGKTQPTTNHGRTAASPAKTTTLPAVGAQPLVVNELRALMTKYENTKHQNPHVDDRPGEQYDYTAPTTTNIGERTVEEAYADQGTFLRQQSDDCVADGTVTDDDNIYENVSRKP